MAAHITLKEYNVLTRLRTGGKLQSSPLRKDYDVLMRLERAALVRRKVHDGEEYFFFTDEGHEAVEHHEAAMLTK